MAGTTRVTLVLPEALWAETQALVPRGQRSRFVADALEAAVRKRRRLVQLQRIKSFVERLPESDPDAPLAAEILEQIREERDAQLTGDS